MNNKCKKIEKELKKEVINILSKFDLDSTGIESNLRDDIISESYLLMQEYNGNPDIAIIKKTAMAFVRHNVPITLEMEAMIVWI